MSIVFQNPEGWVLLTQPLNSEPCVRWTQITPTSPLYDFKRRCFHVVKNHFSHSSAAALPGEDTDVLQQTNKHGKKRKRRRSELNQGEVDSQAFHEKVRSVIQEGTKSLVDSSQSLGYMNGEADGGKDPPPVRECRLAALCDMAKELPLVDDEEPEAKAQLLISGGHFSPNVDLFSQVTEHNEPQAALVTLLGEEYIIPPHTAFLLSDFTRLKPLVDYGKNFDLIVIDPPWENKSVKRSKRYASLPPSQLKRLPIPQLASSNSLIVTWVTNRPSHLHFVRDELYPHWGVQFLAEWFWVKVTTSGEFVFPLDSQHKKPYEVLVLGRYRGAASHRMLETTGDTVENNRLIVSVPSVLHSQKPPLAEILKSYVRPGAECLELFARSLHPGWTSWGNEVLKFQHSSFFILTPERNPVEGPDEPTASEPLTSSETSCRVSDVN